MAFDLDIEIAGGLARRIVRLAMHRTGEDVRPIGKDTRRPVTLMNITIEDQDRSCNTLGNQAGRAVGKIIEHAISGAMGEMGMVRAARSMAGKTEFKRLARRQQRAVVGILLAVVALQRSMAEAATAREEAALQAIFDALKGETDGPNRTVTTQVADELWTPAACTLDAQQCPSSPGESRLHARVAHTAAEEGRACAGQLQSKEEGSVCTHNRIRRTRDTSPPRHHHHRSRRRSLGPLFVDLDESLVEDLVDLEILAGV